MFSEFREIKSGKKELRSFGIVMGVAFALAGGLFLRQGKAYSTFFLILSAHMFGFSIFVPVLLKPLHKIWMGFAVVMGWIVTRVILIILYYAVLTPISGIARLCGKRFLDTDFKADKETYWISRHEIVRYKSSYEKQF